MKWANLAPDIHAMPLSGFVKGWSALDIVSLLGDTQALPRVTITEEVRAKVLKHLSSQSVELGGLLIGSVFSSQDLEEGIIGIEVKDAIASQVFNSSSVSLSMTPEVWQNANQLCGDNTFVVGWYHSHPNLGAYFSGTDRKTQRDFFNNAYSLGLVIDPVRHEECWFLGPDSVQLSLKSISTD